MRSTSKAERFDKIISDAFPREAISRDCATDDVIFRTTYGERRIRCLHLIQQRYDDIIDTLREINPIL